MKKQLCFIVITGFLSMCAMAGAALAEEEGLWCGQDLQFDAAMPDEFDMKVMGGPCPPGDAVCCGTYAQGMRDQCLGEIVNQAQSICEAQLTTYCTSFTYIFCEHQMNPYCLFTVFQMCMDQIAPQMLYNCILDHLGATSGSCANVYDSAFSYCMNP